MIDISKVYYLNLDRRPDRRDFIESELRKISLFNNKCERYSAIDGRFIHPRSIDSDLLTENATEDCLLDNITAYGLSINQGSLGVLLTYLKLFEQISLLDSPAITVEDDTVFNDDFDESLVKVLEELPEDFDLCYLGHGDTHVIRFPYSENLSIPSGVVTCLPALIISPKGAKVLLSVLRGLDNQIDTALYLRLDKLNCFITNTRLVTVKNEFKTDIQGNSNCKKLYKKQNYIFSTLASGREANLNAFKLANDLKFFNQKILIVTDTPEYYEELNNVITVLYQNETFSYSDKILCFIEGFKIEDCVVYLDSDCRIFYDSYKSCYTNFFRIIEPGYHPSWTWGYVKDNGFFKDTDISNRVKGYGSYALTICKELNIDTDSAKHFQEAVLILSKEGGRENIFLDTWKELSSRLDNYEKSNGAVKVGVGEGNLIGLSLVKSKLTVHSNFIANKIGNDIKYNFFGIYYDEYVRQYPNRQMVKEREGVLIKGSNTEVDFKDVKVNLLYSIFKTEKKYVLNFEWNLSGNVEFLDHAFKVNDVIYHFDSIKYNEFYFEGSSPIEIYHTYDWYGETDWKLLETI